MNTFFSQRRYSRRWIAGLLLTCCFFIEWQLGRACADEPELTSLVGDNVGVCVELRDLRTHIREVPSTIWFQRIRELSLVQRWQQSSEFARWQSGQETLALLVGQPLGHFVSELFGESVVLAVWPTQSGPPLAVVMSRAEKDDSWDRALTLWDQLEAHDVQTKSAFGRSYQLRRKKTNGQTTGPDIFTVKLGRTLAISEREEVILDVVARAASTPKDDRVPPLDQSPTYRRAMSALPDGSAVRIFVDPRRWDAVVAKQTTSPTWLLPLWKQLDWFSAGLEVRDGLVFHAVAHHDTKQLPQVWERFVAASNSSSDLADRLPADALLAGESRIAPELFGWLRTLDPSDKSQRDWQTFAKVTQGLLGRDLFDEVLPSARPNLGGAVVPKKSFNAQSAPVDGMLAWEFNLSDSQPAKYGQPQLRESLDGTLLTLLNFAAIAQNSRNPDSPAILKIEHRESLTLKWLEGLPPYRPAYGLSAEHVLISTDPTLISAFHNRSSENTALNSNPLFAAVRARYVSDHSHWLFLSARAAREFLHAQHEPLSRQVAQWRKLAAPSVEAQFDRVRELLTPFDAAFLAAKVTHGEVRFTAGVVTPTPDR